MRQDSQVTYEEIKAQKDQVVKKQIVETIKSALRKSPSTGTHCWNPRSRQATLACIMLQLLLHINIFLSWSTSFTSTIPSESLFPYFKETWNCPKIKPKEWAIIRHFLLLIKSFKSNKIILFKKKVFPSLINSLLTPSPPTYGCCCLPFF